MTAPPVGIQLDLLSAIVRLRQIGEELEAGRDGFAMWLLTDRVLTCDVPRLESHLTDATRTWWVNEAG